MSWVLKPKNKVVPITLGFDHNQIVGSVTLDLSRCPPNPDWSLSLGFMVEEGQNDLVCFGVIPDIAYKTYVNNRVGKEA